MQRVERPVTSRGPGSLGVELLSMGVLAAKSGSIKVDLMAVAILALMAANAAAEAPSLSCASNLTPCQQYMNSSKPPEQCCKPLKDAVTNDLSCLCAIFLDPDILKAFHIDINQALKLPFNCGITTSSANLCNSTAAGSPQGSPGSPGTATPGNDNNGASGSTRVGLLGMVGLFLIWWSTFA